jgi:predicted nuclease of predicted toxin-antitoxin system
MIQFLVDECRPKAVVDRLRADGHDVRYAAETDHQVADDELLARANAENRIIVTEDFDFGDLLVRDLLPATGVIILYLPKMEPDGRAERLAAILADPAFDPSGRLTIIEGRRVRQRALDLS